MTVPSPQRSLPSIAACSGLDPTRHRCVWEAVRRRMGRFDLYVLCSACLGLRFLRGGGNLSGVACIQLGDCEVLAGPGEIVEGPNMSPCSVRPRIASTPAQGHVKVGF